MNSIPGLLYAFSERKHHISSSINENLEAYARELGFDGSIIYLKQIHSDKTVIADEHPGEIPEGDALVTNKKGLLLAVKTADCVPVLIHDPVNGAIAAVHSGWKGTRDHIVIKTIGKMEEIYSTTPGDVSVFIGPSIMACCYEVGEDVARFFREIPGAVKEGAGKFKLELKAVILNDLKSIGVKNIEDIPACTSCEKEKYFSHRRDRTDKRMYSVIALV